MRVLAYDEMQNLEFAQQFGITYTSLEVVLQESDFLTIHLPLTDKTRGLLGIRELALMKENACLVNTARGGIVDEEALFTTLKEGKIKGAALDVYAVEPPWGNPLCSLPNVICTPHTASDSVEALCRMDEISAENVIRVLQGKKPLFSVNANSMEGG